MANQESYNFSHPMLSNKKRQNSIKGRGEIAPLRIIAYHCVSLWIIENHCLSLRIKTIIAYHCGSLRIIGGSLRVIAEGHCGSLADHQRTIGAQIE